MSKKVGELVLVGMGSNIGEPISQLTAASLRVQEIISPLDCSPVYRSRAVGYSTQPDFLNVVCAGRTVAPPSDILQHIREIEVLLGRVRSFPNAPRTIDIDVLTYGDVVLDAPELILPHPRLHQRAFVLVPLAEIAPEWRHPVFGKTAADLLREAGPLERVERVGRLPGF